MAYERVRGLSTDLATKIVNILGLWVWIGHAVAALVSGLNCYARLAISTALVPPNANEFDITAPISIPVRA